MLRSNANVRYNGLFEFSARIFVELRDVAFAFHCTRR